MGMPFQFTHSGRGATYRQGSPCTRRCRFNSRTLGRVRLHPSRRCASRGCFNSRTLGRVRPTFGCNFLARSMFQFTHPGRGATGIGFQHLALTREFQFTHPGRGATRTLARHSSWRRCFNSRTPGGVRPYHTYPLISTASVSIHAPREGCDVNKSSIANRKNKFQFTHPGRGATLREKAPPLPPKVSIHAPREGCDLSKEHPASQHHLGFNSRTPGGVRPRREQLLRTCLDVSIHAPREGCDVYVGHFGRSYDMFQFTHPGRGATDPQG